MWLTRFSINRPVTTFMACLLVVILGGVALSRLAVDLMPNVIYPTVSITTLYDGAGPTEVETLVTHPIEQAVGSVQGVSKVESTSSEGASNISVTFRWGTNIDTAIGDMRAALEKIRRRLPDDIDFPQIRRYNAADTPVLTLAVGGKMSPLDLTRLAETKLIPMLENVNGVAAVTLRGETRREIHVDIDRAKLESLNLGINEVVQALKNENVNQPAGSFDEGQSRLLVRARGDFRSLDEISDTVVRQHEGAVVRVRDVGEVVDGTQELTQLTRINGRSGMILNVNKRSDANTVQVSDDVRKAIKEINGGLTNAELVIRVDRAEYIRQSIENIRISTRDGMILTVMVLIVFLHSFRSTLVIALSMPISLIGTFAMMYFQGFSLNIVSFGGLALGIGMLVDNSIVVLESIFLKIDEGLPPKEAAAVGTEEVAMAVIASTVATLIVFVPLMFIEGMTGVLLHQLAWVITHSLLISLFTSFTLTPVLAAYWLPRDVGKLPTGKSWNPVVWLHRTNKYCVDRLEHGYEWILRRSLKHAGFVIFLLFLTFTSSLGLLPRIGTELVPKTDEGDLGVDARMAPGTHLTTLDRQTRLIEDRVLAAIPESERRTYGTFVGDSAENSDNWNESRVRVMLVSRSQRKRSADEIRKELAKSIGEISGMSVQVRTLGSMSLGSVLSFGDGDVVVRLRGHDLTTMTDLAMEVEKRIRDIPGVINIQLPRMNRRPELTAVIDRRQASQLGVTIRDISQTLETTIRGTDATLYREGGDEFHVRVRLKERDRSRLGDVEQIAIATPQHKRVPLKNLLSFGKEESPVNISRAAQQRCVGVSMQVEGRDVGSVVADIRDRLRDFNPPDGYSWNIAGGWEQQQESFKMLQWGFVLSIVLMYMVMAAQYESFRDPFLILLTVPLGAVGVICAMVFTNTTLNVQSFIGIIMLSGIVVNNAIVLIDYMNQLRETEPQLSLDERVVRGATRRFRPILMTTLTTILAMLPLAMSTAEGGEMEAPLARVVVGGLAFGKIVTLVAIPIVYRWAERLRKSPKPAVETPQTA